MRYHLTSVRMAKIKKFTYNKCWRGRREKGTILYCWWECKLVHPLWRTVWRVLKKLSVAVCVCLVSQSCPTLCEPMDSHQAALSTGTLQTRLLARVAMPFSK